jgi:putative addiction module component (TIGR02574 family)
LSISPRCAPCGSWRDAKQLFPGPSNPRCPTGFFGKLQNVDQAAVVENKWRFTIGTQTATLVTMTAIDIARLSPQERLDLIGALWDSLTLEDVSLGAAQEAELARRMATFEADKQSAVAWETLDAELERHAQ